MFEDDLDDIDLRLLEAMQQNARAKLAELGDAIGLKPPAVHDRVRRLEQRGFIRGYTVSVDLRRLGLPLGAFISVYTMPDANYERLYAVMAALPEILEVHSVAAEETFIVKVVTATTEHLDDFLARLKAVDGIARTKTVIVLTTPFQRQGVALSKLLGDRVN